MCVRFVPLKYEEAEAVLSAQRTGGQQVLPLPDFNPMYDAYPGSDVPIYLWDKRLERLVTKKMTWGFDLDGKRSAVFNTRLETALMQLRRGRRGMWYRAITEGRCLIPVKAFYENHATERLVDPTTGRTARRPYRFTMLGARAFLLAGVSVEGRFSVVTVPASADVAPVHDRMPLVLGRGDSGRWVGDGFETFERTMRPMLNGQPER